MSGLVRRLAAPALRLGTAALGGWWVYASFPPHTAWWAAIPGFALLALALAPTRGSAPLRRTGALVGFAFGCGLFGPLLPWVGGYVGQYAWLGLTAVEAAYLLVFGAGATQILRWARPGGAAGGVLRGVAGAIGLASWWVAVEWLRSSWPWGGFPWGRVAFGQADGPLLPAAALGGESLLGWCVVLLGAGLALAILAVLATTTATTSAVAAAAVTALAAAALAALPAVAGTHARWTVHGPGEADEHPDQVQVALVQGNVPRLGLDFNAQRRAVLDNHVRETDLLAADVRAGRRPHPDLVVWPENASDVSPLANPDAAALLTRSSEEIGAPILVGTVLRVGAGPETTNTMLVWDGARGPVGRHDKRFVQPFGEWLPWRGAFEALFPIAKSAGHITPGPDSAPVTVAGHTVAVATCYEVAFSAAAREPVAAGAQILTVPTNNATFGRSPMTYQQLGMSRVRAVEHHVPVLVAATSGVSAVVDPAGHVTSRTQIFEPAALSATVPASGAGTVATHMGAAVETGLAAAGALAVCASWWATRRRRPDPTAPSKETV